MLSGGGHGTGDRTLVTCTGADGTDGEEEGDVKRPTRGETMPEADNESDVGRLNDIVHEAANEDRRFKVKWQLGEVLECAEIPDEE